MSSVISASVNGGLFSGGRLAADEAKHAPLDGAAHRAAVDDVDAGALGDLGADLGKRQGLVDVVLVDVAEAHVLAVLGEQARGALAAPGPMALPNSTQRVSTACDLVVGESLLTNRSIGVAPLPCGRVSLTDVSPSSTRERIEW